MKRAKTPKKASELSAPVPTEWEKAPDPGAAFDALSDAQKEAVFRSLHRPSSLKETRPLNAAERKRWAKIKKRLGRPKVGQGVKVISLSVEKGLLERADAYAKRLGLTRAEVVARGLKRVLN